MSSYDSISDKIVSLTNRYRLPDEVEYELLCIAEELDGLCIEESPYTISIPSNQMRFDYSD